MKKRIFAVSLISASLLSACSLGGSSDTVIGEFNFSPKILNPDPLGYEVLENQVSAFTVSATDPDLDPLSLEISGTDGALFTHTGGGVIEFRDPPDFEMPGDADANNVYRMTITVSDGENSDVVDFAVTVLDDVADNPVVTADCGEFKSDKGLSADRFKSCKMAVDGTDRSFVIYLPEGSSGLGNTSPLLFSLHGQNETAEDNILYTNFAQIADQSGAILVFPQAGTSEVTGQTQWDSKTDTAFISAISDYMSDSYAINSDQVYAAGKSEGGAMVFDLACSASSGFAAIGVVGGSMTSSSIDNCPSNATIPLVQIHGKLDNIIPIAGNSSYLHLDAVTGFWAGANNCASITNLAFIEDSNSDSDILGGTHAQIGDCDMDTSMAVYAMDGLGSEWPNQNGFDIDASSILWSFMSGYDLNGPIQ